MSLSNSDQAKLNELDRLCAECKQAITEQPDSQLKAVMQEACDKCKSVRGIVPELMELRQQSEDFNRDMASKKA